MRLISPLVALTALSIAASATHAQSPYTFDAARRLATPHSVGVSPDGKTATFVVTRPNFETNQNESELWAVDLAAGAPRALTTSHKVIGETHWSPDGKTLAFLTPDSSGKMQIFVMPTAGGEARQITTHPTGVEQFSWRPDGGAIAYGANDESPKKEGEAKFNSTFTVGAQDMFRREQLPSQHIWTIALDGSAARRRTSGAWTLEFVLPPGSPPSGLSWSPDGTRIAFAQTVAPESGKLDSTHVAIVDVASSAITPLTGMRTFENNPVWSPNGKSVAYWMPRDHRADLGWVNEVYIASASGGSTNTGKSITRTLDRNLFGAQWMPDGKSLLVAGNDRTTTGVWIQPLDGAAMRINTGDLVVSGAFGYDITVAKTGALVFTATTPRRPAEVYLMDSPTSAPRRLSDFNGWANSIAFGKTERVTWKAEQFEADGTVTYPANFDPAKNFRSCW